jgi:osmotically inducible protein OsmC
MLLGDGTFDGTYSPGIDQAELERFAGAAKDGCPVSKALAGVAEITVDARLAT